MAPTKLVPNIITKLITSTSFSSYVEAVEFSDAKRHSLTARNKGKATPLSPTRFTTKRHHNYYPAQQYSHSNDRQWQ
jgi:hypothetical protein